MSSKGDTTKPDHSLHKELQPESYDYIEDYTSQESFVNEVQHTPVSKSSFAKYQAHHSRTPAVLIDTKGQDSDNGVDDATIKASQMENVLRLLGKDDLIKIIMKMSISKTS